MNYVETEQRVQIPDFPRYEVSNFGEVYNIRTGRQMILSPTNEGVLTVGLMWEDEYGRTHQYRRSVRVLVAKAFVPGETKRFDTPIQLDGDRENLYATNLMWRPRWFACLYSRQFWNTPSWVYVGPVTNTTTNMEYENIYEAGIHNGHLFKDIRWSILGQSGGVFPGNEKYIQGF